MKQEQDINPYISFPYLGSSKISLKTSTKRNAKYSSNFELGNDYFHNEYYELIPE